MASRSTFEWYSVVNFIGLYPVGVGEGGLRSTYAGNLRSRGPGVLAVSRPLGLRTRAQVCNYYVENLFNTIFMEGTIGRAVGAGQFTLGGPFISVQRARPTRPLTKSCTSSTATTQSSSR